MRLVMTLRPERADTSVPVNYQYLLAGAMYALLSRSAPEYAAFLHDEGYESSNGRRLKLFAFSWLWSDRRPVLSDGRLRWYGRPRLRLIVASPMHETFVRAVVLGLFRNSRIVLNDVRERASFSVAEVDVAPPPEWREALACVARSPLTVSVQDRETGRIRYLRPDDPRFGEGLAMNLLRKHEIVNGPLHEPLRCLVEPESAYAETKGGWDKLSRLVTVREGRPGETRVRGFVFPFVLRCDPPLLQTAWDCGLGEKNSLGFGMWEESTGRDREKEGEEKNGRS
ncbi:MAG: CRISPR-associated endoribonuclease Cas6 [Bacteroidota bacterium]|nr:CRISPR-associated endoribonuclease Cas6 [Bacteroidota bacterium]